MTYEKRLKNRQRDFHCALNEEEKNKNLVTKEMLKSKSLADGLEEDGGEVFFWFVKNFARIIPRRLI